MLIKTSSIMIWNSQIDALRKAAKNRQNSEFVGICTGQTISEFSSQSTTIILEKLIGDVEKVSGY